MSLGTCQAGRYDPVSDELDGGSTSFHIMMVIFNFFTAILLLNILIGMPEKPC